VQVGITTGSTIYKLTDSHYFYGFLFRGSGNTVQGLTINNNGNATGADCSNYTSPARPMVVSGASEWIFEITVPTV
jgi:hypothetical protein